VRNEATPISLHLLTSAPEVGTGGTLVSGHYELIEKRVYNQASNSFTAGTPIFESIDVDATAGRMEIAVVVNGGGPPPIAAAVTANSGSGAFSLVGDCAPTIGDLGVTSFTAAGDELIFFGTEPVGNAGTRFKLDPPGPATACTDGVNDATRRSGHSCPE
jgi:hypothetical protein